LEWGFCEVRRRILDLLMGSSVIENLLPCGEDGQMQNAIIWVTEAARLLEPLVDTVW